LSQRQEDRDEVDVDEQILVNYFLANKGEKYAGGKENGRGKGMGKEKTY